VKDRLAVAEEARPFLPLQTSVDIYSILRKRSTPDSSPRLTCPRIQLAGDLERPAGHRHAIKDLQRYYWLRRTPGEHPRRYDAVNPGPWCPRIGAISEKRG